MTVIPSESPLSPGFDAAAAIGRVLLAAIFIIAGFGKLADPSGTIAYIASHGLPLPALAYAGSLAVEIVGGLMFLVGFKTRYAALALGLFSIVAGLLFHNNFGNMIDRLMLLKDLAMGGGFLQVFAFGGGAYSLDARRGRS